VTFPTPPIILIIDDDDAIGRPLKRLADQSFAPDGFQVFWVKNGLAGVELARQYADQLRLIVLDVKMKLMNGTLAAVQIRRSLPHVPIMPFTSYAESLPALVELGCVLPLVKRPDIIAELPARMRRAMTMSVKPLPDSAWVTALQQSGDDVLAFVQQGNLQGVIANDGQTTVQIQRAVSLLDKYCRRVNTLPAREIQQVRKVLQQVAGE
jgi:DNA-binding response OmpR family regulator